MSFWLGSFKRYDREQGEGEGGLDATLMGTIQSLRSRLGPSPSLERISAYCVGCKARDRNLIREV